MIGARRILPSLILVAAVLAAYSNALGAGFVLDDYHYILEHRELVLRNIPRLFISAYRSGNEAFYRPLSTADFAVDRSLFGLSAFAFHALNVAWHIGATLTLRWMLARVTSERVAFAAALVFAVHPLHTEAVTGIIGRMELMTAAFVFAGCRLHLDGRRVLASIAYVLAMMSKENGVVLPLLAVVLELRRRVGLDARARDVPSAMRRAWPFAVAFVVYAPLRFHALANEALPPPAEYFAVATRGQALVTAVDVLGRDLRLLVWPAPLVADYSYPALPIASLGGAAIALAMIAALAFAAHRYPSLRLPLAWAAIAILPVSNLVVRIGVLMAERLLYLPSVAIALVLAQLYDSLHRRARPLVANAALAALAIAFAGLTLARNADWQTPLALWRDTVDKQPRSALAHANLAASCLTVGDTTCAKQELRRAVALDPLRADFRALLDELR